MRIHTLSNPVSESILQVIGHTPLVELAHLPHHPENRVLAKLEGCNPGGSIKDRTALNIIHQALRSGHLKKGDTVVESSSGNMAVGLAQVCSYYGLRLIVVVDPKLNDQTAQILRVYGAQIEQVTTPTAQGGYLAARLARVHEILEQNDNVFWSNQYGNKSNPRTHHETMEEMYQATDGRIDYLFVATSTCGTLMGCADYIYTHDFPTKVIAVDAVGSVLFGGKPSKRIIPGHGSAVPSQFLKEDYLHDCIKMSDLDCVKGCWNLLRSESILGGGSSGAIISAYQRYEANIPEGSTVALLLSDRGDRYLDTIYHPEWLQAHFPSFQIPKPFHHAST